MEKFEKDGNGMMKKWRDTQPILHHPHEMTESIISRVKSRQANLKHDKSRKIILLLRPIMAAAASLLIGLFIYQNLDHSTPGMNQPGYSGKEKMVHSNTSDGMRLHRTLHEEVIEKFKQCSENTRTSFTQLDRKCLLSVISEYNARDQINDKKTKQKLLHRYNQITNTKVP